MKKQNGSTPLVWAVITNLLCLVLAFAASNSVNYYFDSGFRAFVDGARIFFAVTLIVSIIWMVLAHNRQPQPKVINKCPHCGSSVSMYSDVCWKCHKSLTADVEERTPQSKATTAQAPQQTVIETPNAEKAIEENEITEVTEVEGQMFEVYFKGLTDSKKIIKVIQVVREVVGLSLADGKQFVENPPSLLKATASKDEAEEIRGLLESVGAIVEIKEKL